MGTTPIEVSNKNIMYSQHQALDKEIQISKIFKGELDRTQKSYASWLVTTINNSIIIPVKEIGPTVFFFKRT